jgi:hypothetical protein
MTYIHDTLDQPISNHMSVKFTLEKFLQSSLPTHTPQITIEIFVRSISFGISIDIFRNVK